MQHFYETYHKVANMRTLRFNSTSKDCQTAYEFDVYLLWPLGEKLGFAIVAQSTVRNFTLYTNYFILGNNDDKMGCKTVSGPSSNASCIFPFKMGYFTFHKCFPDPTGHICATLVDDYGELTTYGYCEQDCNLKIGKKKFIRFIFGLNSTDFKTI